MMRIAWLANYPYLRLEPHLVMRRPMTGHPSSWVVNLANALGQRADIELHVVTLCPHITTEKRFAAEGALFHILPSGVPFSDRGFPWYLPLDVLSGFHWDRKHLVREIRTIHPNLVHAFGTEGPYALAAIDSGYPHLIHIQGILQECIRVEPSLRSRFAVLLEKRAIRNGKHFSCRTDFDSACVLSHNSHAEIVHIHEVIGPAFFKMKWTVQENDNVLFVGALKRRKGIEDLLEAVHLLAGQSRRVHLNVVGSGPTRYLAHLMDRCRQLGICDCVEFLGYRSSDEIAKLHEQSQVFVLPSHVENSPNSVAEAMVSGVPVIASKVGGIPSMIRHLDTGLLVEPQSPQELADAIDVLLSSATKRRQLSVNARNVARARHHPASIVVETIKAYTRISSLRKGDIRRMAAPAEEDRDSGRKG